MLSFLLMLFGCAAVLLLACWRARKELDAEASGRGGAAPEDLVFVDSRAALAMPVLASVGLVAMYLVGTLFWGVVAAYSVVSLYTVPFVMRPRGGSGRWVDCPRLTAAALVLVWLWTGHWVVHDVLVACLVATMLCLVRVDNLRSAALLLAGLAAYDVFWVFFSKRVVGEGVMVSVATAHAGRLHTPGALLFPIDAKGTMQLLGAGDLAFPGIAIVTLLRYDFFHNANFDYTAAALAGWLLGMTVCNFALDVTHASQPALIYLAPGTLLPPLVAAWWRGDAAKVFWGWEERGGDEGGTLLAAMDV